MVKNFLPKHTAAEKRGNERKTEILRAFGDRLTRRSHAPKPRALPTALHPDSVFRSARRGVLSVFPSAQSLVWKKAPPGVQMSARTPRLLTVLADLYARAFARTVRCFLFFWGEIWDSNPRPSGPQPDALTNCANPTILFLACLGGFEPSTYCLEGSCSIQLS